MSISIQAPEKLLPVSIGCPPARASVTVCSSSTPLDYSAHPIKNLSDSDDTDAMLRVFRRTAAFLTLGRRNHHALLTAYLAKQVGEWTLTGSTRMKQRPIHVLVDALNKLGGRVEYIEKEGFPPLRIFGSALVGGDLELPGDVSSQYISALLMIGPYMEKGLRLKLTGNIT